MDTLLSLLIRIGIPVVATLIALWLANIIRRKRIKLRVWHGTVGIIIAFIMVFVGAGSNLTPLVIAGLILGLPFAAILFAANGKPDEDGESHEHQ